MVPNSWQENGGQGQIYIHEGTLQIYQTPQVHQKIQELLAEKRKQGETEKLQERLNTSIDLSALKGGVPLSQAIEYIQNSVDPPLPITVDWDDLKEKAGVLPTDKARPRDYTRAPICDALYETLYYVSKDKELPIEYIIENNRIVIKTNPYNLIRKSYTIDPKLKHDVTGRSIDPSQLHQLIIDRLRPLIYSQKDFRHDQHLYRHSIACDSDTLTVLATEEAHKEIAEKLANLEPFDLRQIAIEARILLVDDNFLEDVGLDVSVENMTSGGVGEVVKGPANSAEILAALEHKPLAERELPRLKTSEQKFETLDNLQTEFILRATEAHRNAKQLQAPKAIVLNGETATMNVTREQRYIDIDDQEKTFKSGIIYDISPTIQEDEKSVHLTGNFQFSDIISWDTLEQNGRKYEVPTTQTSKIAFNAIVENRDTILLGGLRLPTTVVVEKKSRIPIVGGLFKKKGTVTEKQRLLILIKPTIIIPDEAEADAIGALAPRRGGGFGGSFERPDKKGE